MYFINFCFRVLISKKFYFKNSVPKILFQKICFTRFSEYIICKLHGGKIKLSLWELKRTRQEIVIDVVKWFNYSDTTHFSIKYVNLVSTFKRVQLHSNFWKKKLQLGLFQMEITNLMPRVIMWFFFIFYFYLLQKKKLSSVRFIMTHNILSVTWQCNAATYQYHYQQISLC